MQFLGLLAVLVAGGVIKKPGMKQIRLAILYSLLDFGLYMGLVGFLQTSKASWTQIQELGSACEGYGKILPGFNYAKGAHLPVHISAGDALSIIFARREPVQELNRISRIVARHESAKTYWTKVGIIIGLLLGGILGLVVLGIILVGLFKSFAGKLHLPLGLISLGLMSGTLFYLVEMELTREVMQSLTGTEFLDNQWGFGQVLSLLLWVPFLVQGLWSFLRPLRKASQKKYELLSSKGSE
ncbi:hypothetical protein BDN72DRAFT_897710 [Pluteus cervinus]|uniref:Uncharacterized protein n=1 Tax=Pluteus cervinus TaxID=181527 RepID=A0ACD3ATY2_9AGAR|nr:hypothetical protein BDN72DRAFT_897710 [Pluteus cervinus]